jgi:hypothetical protein
MLAQKILKCKVFFKKTENFFLFLPEGIRFFRQAPM